MTLTDHRDAVFDLDALCAAAGALLARTTPADPRAAALPDPRTVRFYQSSGIVDRPSGYDGRTAMYGYRHLVQVVAVKLLQAKGHTLAQVQRALAGVPTDRLEAAVLADLGAPVPPPAPRGTLVSVALAPGVIVVVDPSLVADPDAVLSKLTRALKEAP